MCSSGSENLSKVHLLKNISINCAGLVHSLLIAFYDKDKYYNHIYLLSDSQTQTLRLRLRLATSAFTQNSAQLLYFSQTLMDLNKIFSIG